MKFMNESDVERFMNVVSCAFWFTVSYLILKEILPSWAASCISVAVVMIVAYRNATAE